MGDIRSQLYKSRRLAQLQPLAAAGISGAPRSGAADEPAPPSHLQASRVL